MALRSRLGAFIVGFTVGSAQCFYWLYGDVQNVSAAMIRKIDEVKHKVAERERIAALQLAALESAAAIKISPNQDTEMKSDTSTGSAEAV